MLARVLGRSGYCRPSAGLYVHRPDSVGLIIMNLAHIHLLLNHWPIIGAFVGLFLFLVAFLANSDDLKQTSLAFFTLIALLAIPTYFSGDVANEVLKELSTRLPKDLVNTHQGAALLSLVFMELTGGLALLGF